MKAILPLAISTALFLGFPCNADDPEAPKVPAAPDLSTPESVVELFFEALATEDYELLKIITPTEEEAPGHDMEEVRFLEKAPEENRSRFKEEMANAKISGDTEYSKRRHRSDPLGDEKEFAKIPILYGPEQTRKEQIYLIKVGDKWLLWNM